MSIEAEQQAWVETWARHIKALDLSPVALPLLEISHAFGFLGSQALLIVQPLMIGILDDTTIRRTAALLDSPKLQDQLRECLEVEENRNEV